MDTKDIIDTINDLIETCKDGEFSFDASADYVHDPKTKQLFIRRADECRAAAHELQRLVLQLAGRAEDGGSISGAMQRGWVAVRGTLAGYTDKAILEEAERGEDTALVRYRAALDLGLPPHVRTVVERQYEGVQRNHAQIRTLRDQSRLTRV